MKADGPTEAPGGLLADRAQQRGPAHGGARSHEAVKAWVARAGCEGCDAPGNYAVRTDVFAFSPVHEMRWLGAAQRAGKGVGTLVICRPSFSGVQLSGGRVGEGGGDRELACP